MTDCVPHPGRLPLTRRTMVGFDTLSLCNTLQGLRRPSCGVTLRWKGTVRGRGRQLKGGRDSSEDAEGHGRTGTDGKRTVIRRKGRVRRFFVRTDEALAIEHARRGVVMIIIMLTTVTRYDASLQLWEQVAAYCLMRGWCLGRNPSFVLGGIQLSGLPALRAAVISAYLPLHPTGRPFHRFLQSPRQLSMPHRHPIAGRSVSASEPRLSPYASQRRGSARWMEFPQPFPGPSAAHRLTSLHNVSSGSTINLVVPPGPLPDPMT